MKNKKKQRTRKSRDNYRPEVTDINRPLTSNRVIDVTHKFTNLSDLDWEYIKTPKVITNISYGNINEFIDELVMDSYQGDYDWFNEVSYHDGNGVYGDFETTLDVNSRKKMLKHINQGYTSPELWDFYTKNKKEITASPEFVEKMGSIGIDCRRKRQRDLSGTIINIDKYMGGEECMESMKRQNSQRCIRFFIDYSQSSREDAMRLTKKVIMAIAICENIERLGFATEIYFGEISRPCLTYRTKIKSIMIEDENGYEHESVHCWKILAKPSGVKIDETYLCNYSLTGIFRDLYFDFARNCLATDSTIGTPLYHCLAPHKNDDFYKKISESDIYIGHNAEFSTLITNVMGVVKEGADVL
tara:strand:+ start:627 stop:1700 length:1074 start_codon:yes stop_codon:yes gene_type:complete